MRNKLGQLLKGHTVGKPFKKGNIPWNVDNKIRIERICIVCNAKFLVVKSRMKFGVAKYCSKKCNGIGKMGENNPNWINGRRLLKTGYVAIYSPNHPKAVSRRYVYEHRLVVEKTIGRYLESWEIVHHINGNRSDNRIENLELYPHTHVGQVQKLMMKEIGRLKCLLEQHHISY